MVPQPSLPTKGDSKVRIEKIVKAIESLRTQAN